MQIYLNYLSENANFRKLADVKEALLSGTSQQALSVSLESLLTSAGFVRVLKIHESPTRYFSCQNDVTIKIVTCKVQTT